MGRRAAGYEDELLELGERIAQRRQSVGLTQPKLAERAGLSLDGLLRIEKGRTAASVVSLFQIADALGCPVTAFLQKEVGRQRSASTSMLVDLLAGQPDDVIEAATACVRSVVKLGSSR